MECRVHDLGELTDYLYVGIFALYGGRLVLCRKRGFDTWEPPGGHIEPGETPRQAAERELYEESGATEYTMEPLCDYWADSTSGVCFVAQVTKLGPLPQSEMEEVALFDTLPEALTYPDITPKLLERLREWKGRGRMAGKPDAEYRVCGVADAALLRDLGEKTYRDTFGPHNTPEDMDEYVALAFTVEKLEEELGNGDSEFVLALVRGEPAGYLKVNRGPAQTELQDETALEIERIYLLDSYQGSGIGGELLDWALNRARREGLAYVWLGVWKKNERAIGFYQRNGFYRFSHHVFRLGSDKQTDYLMRRDLV